MKSLKAFTLVELIVVIAIIGVLASILVPSLLGFTRDSKIAAANSNAHTVYTSAQAWITKYAIKNGTVNTRSKSEGWHNGSDTLTLDASEKLDEYLGVTFKGVYGFQTDSSGSMIVAAYWFRDAASAPPLPAAPVTPAVQDSDAAAGKIIGYYPLAT